MRSSSWLERGMSEADGARRGGEGAHVGSGEAVGRDAFGMRAMQDEQSRNKGSGVRAMQQGARRGQGACTPSSAGEHVLSAMVSVAALNHGALIMWCRACRDRIGM